MVFLSTTLFSRSRGPDEFWRKRKIFRLSAHFRNRARNCYSNSIRAVHRSLQFATKNRDPKREWIRKIWQNRIEFACSEHNSNKYELKAGLTRCQVLLNNKSLAELAIWEPRTFNQVVRLACAKLKQDGLQMLNKQALNNVYYTSKSLPK